MYVYGRKRIEGEWGARRMKNENDLDGGEIVIWRGKEYITGNRRHSKVELYKEKKFIRIVNIESVKRKRES